MWTVGWEERTVKVARRLCVAVDLEGFGARPPHVQALLQRRLRRLLAPVWRECGVRPWRVWQGDGEVALAPRGTDESAVVSAFCRALRVALRRANRELGIERMRVRVAIHTGSGAASRAGLVGAGVVRTCRLLDCTALHAALVAHSRADLAVLVSQALFEDVICAEEHELTGADFVPVRVVSVVKSFTADAWLYVPDPGCGGDVTALDPARCDHHALPERTSGLGSAGAASRRNVASQNQRVGDSIDRAASVS